MVAKETVVQRENGAMKEANRHEVARLWHQGNRE